ncbi:MAG: GNAT family N-acetyltransferase [Pseudomonadota bacterium]|nr:GNAT family N-acetyltransferase [Pseudomonadota bacterium]
MNTTLRPANTGDLPTLIEIDDLASQLFFDAGLSFNLDENHPFVIAEAARWSQSIEQGLAQVALTAQGTVVGFATCRYVDNQHYLDQLSVHPQSMRAGIGSRLLDAVIVWSGSNPLWLTTYSHLPWNGPYYKRKGFAAIDDAQCGPELLGILDEQRAVLPDPQQRIAMVRYS